MGENQNPSQLQMLGSLARELKVPLTLIARQAELESMNTFGELPFESIKTTAEQALKLIDSYLLLSQSEHGQIDLPLQTTGIGSVIYEVIEEFRPIAKKHNIGLVSDINDYTVMTHKAGLKSALWCMLNLSLESLSEEEMPERRIIVSAKNARNNNVSVSILGNLELSPSDVALARKMQGNSHLALSVHTGSSGIHLALADLFASSAGSNLKPMKKGSARGLTMNIAKSQQLQLV